MPAPPPAQVGANSIPTSLAAGRPHIATTTTSPATSRRPVGSPLGFASQTRDDGKLAHCSVADHHIPSVRQTSRLPQTTEGALPPTVSTADPARSCGVRLWLAACSDAHPRKRELPCC